MASAKAPFGTMHNQPKAKPKRRTDPAPWDKDSSYRSPSLLKETVSRAQAKVSTDKEQLPPPPGPTTPAVRRPKLPPPPPPAFFRSSTASPKLVGSTKTAPFGTAHNAPTQRNQVAAPSPAPWDRDDSQRFQKIAFGNLKSFGAFIRT